MSTPYDKMRKLITICMGATLGVIVMPCFNYAVAWIAYLLLSAGKPVWNHYLVLFSPTQLWVTASFAALGACSALAWSHWRTGKQHEAVKTCIWGGVIVAAFATVVALRNIWLVLQMVGQSETAKTLTSNLTLWKLNYAIRYLAVNSPVFPAALLVLLGVILALALRRRRSI